MEQLLRTVVGLQLSLVRRSVTTRSFHFGRLEIDGSRSWGEWVLSVQCPWRLERDGVIVTGSHDVALPADGWPSEPRNGDDDANLQDAAFVSLLGSKERLGRSARNETSILVVEGMEVSGPCDLSIALSGGFVLKTFSDATAGVQWRFFRPDADETAVLVEDGKVVFNVA